MSELQMRTIALMAILLAAPFLAANASTLDQSVDPSASAQAQGRIIIDTQHGSTTVSHAQTFTVGALGNLDRVDILISQSDSPPPLIIDIWAINDGLPALNTGSALASVLLWAPVVPLYFPGWVSVDFSGSPVPVTPGQQLALVLRPSYPSRDGQEYRWVGGGGGGLYTGGAAYYWTSLSAEWAPMRGGSAPDPMDYGFRTYVTPVPEPAALQLFGGCVVFGLGFYAFQRRCQRQG